MWGSDQAASIEPQGLRRLVKDIRSVESSLGDGQAGHLSELRGGQAASPEGYACAGKRARSD